MFHIIYFVFVILLGSFYLMNVILAIVAMSYDEVRLANLANEEEEEAEKKVCYLLLIFHFYMRSFL